MGGPQPLKVFEDCEVHPLLSPGQESLQVFIWHLQVYPPPEERLQVSRLYLQGHLPSASREGSLCSCSISKYISSPTSPKLQVSMLHSIGNGDARAHLQSTSQSSEREEGNSPSHTRAWASSAWRRKELPEGWTILSPKANILF